MSEHLQLQCWDCHEALDEAESVKVPTHMGNPFSTSTTRVHPECARWREEHGFPKHPNPLADHTEGET